MSHVFQKMGNPTVAPTAYAEPARNVFPAAMQQTPAALPMQNLIVTDSDIDKIGEDVSREIGQTTQKIIDKMVVGKFDDLGAILTQITGEVDKLDPASLQKGGVVGWLQNKFTDVKATLTMRLKSAQGVFDNLEGKIGTHITTQQEWVKDLESLYMENFQHYQKIVAEMGETERLIAYVDNQIKSWPEIDMNSPTAAMAIQQTRDAETKLNRLRMKLDNLVRLKAMTELNSPKIRQQQDTSRVTISTLKDIISQTIPIVKMEFALYIQTVDSQKSIKLTNEVRTLATKTLTQGADSAKMAAIASAKALNTPVITSDTLQILRNRVMETVIEVKRVETDAQAKREQEAVQIVEGQKSLLTALKAAGTI
ncbi:putative von Willebrand factor type A domain protein [Pseudomonas phage psageK4]|uniref:von Willebrand factor type A domain protein n=1 Tax=Pseudomonas phage psageK4 TaxID=2859563 RepID=A0ABX8SM46_9CAUD|nr:putative von Willebrand factor type A domain protein [Pseudomonas phage psageK4]QXV71672.1 putative von Willebrand factor type A domain protein [Pseudomonas phage psageK4]